MFYRLRCEKKRLPLVLSLPSYLHLLSHCSPGDAGTYKGGLFVEKYFEKQRFSFRDVAYVPAGKAGTHRLWFLNVKQKHS